MVTSIKRRHIKYCEIQNSVSINKVLAMIIHLRIVYDCFHSTRAELNSCHRGGLPAGSVVKNLPAKAGDTGSVPELEGPTCHGTTKPMHHNHALEPRSHNCWSPHTLQSVVHSKRSCCIKKPARRHWKVAPYSLQLEESPRSNEDAAQPKININT